jgi:hypothetical protein
MENKAKIRINLNLREFEIEGSEAFINSHSAKIESFLEILKTAPPIIREPKTHHKEKDVIDTKTVIAPSAHKGNSDSIPETFGEYFHEMPKKSKDADKILLAGQFVQSKSSDNLFSTREASNALLEQGVKLSNSSVFVSQNERAKYIIKISKGKFRVSKTGLEHIEELLAGQTDK